MTKTKKVFLLLSIFIIGCAVFVWAKTPTENKIDLEMKLGAGESDPSCNSGESFRAKNCTEYVSTQQIERPEWTALFPQANFFLIETETTLSPETFTETSAPNNRVLVEQDGQRYKAESFDKLLKANHITINDESRELALKSFALLTAANYLSKEFRFLPLEEVNYAKGETRHPYNYQLSALVNGKTELNWYFVIKDRWIHTITYQNPKGIKDYFFNP